MKVYRTLTIAVIVIFGISVLSTGVVNITAEDPMLPTLSLVAQYNPAISVDGNYLELMKDFSTFMNLMRVQH